MYGSRWNTCGIQSNQRGHAARTHKAWMPSGWLPNPLYPLGLSTSTVVADCLYMLGHVHVRHKMKAALEYQPNDSSGPSYDTDLLSLYGWVQGQRL